MEDETVASGASLVKRTPDEDHGLIALTADVISAFVSNNSLASADLPNLISSTYSALRGVTQSMVEVSIAELKPATSIRNSITPDFIICLDDGKSFKSLRRHIGSLGMTPDQYRAKWKLPRDYPMVAPNYSSTRSALAKKSGLGRKRSTST